LTTGGATQGSSRFDAELGGPALPEVLEEHLDELRYLSIQRRKLLFSPEIPLGRLEPHEQRIAAHLDALAIGGAASALLAEARLSADEPWTLYAAVRAWLGVCRPARDVALERLAAIPSEAHAGLREALRALSAERVLELFPADEIARLPDSLKAPAVDALGWHGALTPQARAESARAASDELRVALARHLGHSGAARRTDEILESLLASTNASVARRALWSLAELDAAAGLALARERIACAEPDAVALRIVGLLGDARDLPRLAAALERDPSRLAGLCAIGELGVVGGLELLGPWVESADEGACLAALTALERIVGALPAARAVERARELDAPAQSGASFLLAAAREAGTRLPVGERQLRGRSLQWRGAGDEEPLESIWRQALVSPRPDAPWLRREVPDGFFDGMERGSAVPGE